MPKKLVNFILIGLLLALVYEVIRDALRDSDFDGYIRAGQAVMDGRDIYSDHFNTWPPFFSILCVPLTLFDSLNGFVTRLLWNFGSLMSMVLIVKYSSKILLQNESTKGNAIITLFQNPLVLIPFLILFRFVLENLANVQINIYILLMTVLQFYLFTKKKYFWVGLLLAFAISIKVYALFFLFYFVYKRAYQVLLSSFVFLFLFNAFPILVFGYEQTMLYYEFWWTISTEQAYTAIHRNQSIFAMFFRFFTAMDPEQDLYVNIASYAPKLVRSFTYGFVLLSGLWALFLMRKREKNRLTTLLEFSILFTIIPILSPISWKAYFIFLWIPYFFLFKVLFHSYFPINTKRLLTLKILYIVSAVINVFSSELFVGRHLSDILETYSCLTIATLILLVLQFYILINLTKVIDLNRAKTNEVSI